MNKTQVTEELHRMVGELRNRYPAFTPDQAFTGWFMSALLVDDEQTAADAVTGGPGDKGVDAIYVDDRIKKVFLVETKYRTKRGRAKPAAEGRASVLGFARLAGVLCDTDKTAFDAHVRTAKPDVREKLIECRKRILKRDYSLDMYYVTLGRFTPVVEGDAYAEVSGTGADLVLFDNARVLNLAKDFLDGAAPSVPVLTLEMESGTGIRIKGTLNRFDKTTNIESWVFSVRGSEIGEIVERFPSRIFARNVRGFLGERTAVNESMRDTLHDDPSHFFYFNNGITIVCDEAKEESRYGRASLIVRNPQIINGQQTSRMLATDLTASSKASVLVRVIRVPREETDGARFDRMVSQIVQSTNWQNAIKQADLMANDAKQVRIDRELRKLGYVYLRKRQTKSEAKLRYGVAGRRQIKKEDLAQAVAGCELDPVVPRSGKDKLFDERHYQDIFQADDPDYYLSRYYAAREVSRASRGYPQRGYMKWMVLHFFWQNYLSRCLRGSVRLQRFRVAMETEDAALLAPLQAALYSIFKQAEAYYNANKGSGDKVQDVSLFFRSKRGRHREFEEFWNRASNRSANKVERTIATLEERLNDA